MLHRHGLLHHLAHNFYGTLEVEALTRSHIQLQRDGIQFLLAVYRQVCALRQILADQAVDVLVAAALPRAMRVTEEDRHAGSLGDLGVSRHLSPLVVGHTLAHCQRHAIKRGTEAFHRRGCRRVVHLHQHQVATGSLYQSADGRGISLALDQIALPMPRHQAVLDLRRTHMNANHLRDLPAPINAARARPACRLTLTQADDQLLAQFADRQSIDRVIDRLATDVGISEAGYVHAAQLAGNLLGRQTFTKHVSHQLETLATWQQLALGAADLAAIPHVLLGVTGRVVAASIPVAAQLTADSRGRSVDQASNPAQAEALGLTDLNGGALFNAEFGIRHRGNTVPERSGVALSFCGRLVIFQWLHLPS